MHRSMILSDAYLPKHLFLTQLIGDSMERGSGDFVDGYGGGSVDADGDGGCDGGSDGDSGSDGAEVADFDL